MVKIITRDPSFGTRGLVRVAWVRNPRPGVVERYIRLERELFPRAEVTEVES